MCNRASAIPVNSDLSAPGCSLPQGVHFARNDDDLTNGFSVLPKAALQLFCFNRSAWYKVRVGCCVVMSQQRRAILHATANLTAAPLQEHTLIKLHTSDVAPFTALNTSTSGLLDDTIQMVVFRFKIWRFLRSSNINTIYPVLSVAVMVIIVFWIPEDELAARVELCAALFLTLIGKQPTSLLGAIPAILDAPCSFPASMSDHPIQRLPFAQPSNLW